MNTTAWDDQDFVDNWNKTYGLEMENAPIRPQFVFPLLRQRIGDFSGLRLIDLGCGNGNLLRVFKGENFAHWTGIDGGSAVIKSAAADLTADPRCALVHADITSPLTIAPRSVDAVTSIFVMEEIPLPRLSGMFTNISRALKQEGAAHVFFNHPANALVHDLEALHTGAPNRKFENHKGYFDTEPTSFALTNLNQAQGHAIKPGYHHKPLSAIMNEVAGAGLHISEVLEVPSRVTSLEKMDSYVPAPGDTPKFMYLKLVHK